MKRILILSVSAGAGHMRAAEAVKAWAGKGWAGHLPGAIVAEHWDVMDYVPAGFRKLYTDAYVSLVSKHPSVWRALYRITSEAEPTGRMQQLRRAIERLNARTLHAAVAEFAPDVILCTHFLPAELLMHETRLGRLAVPVYVQVTDFDLHRMWVMPYIAGYFVANAEVAYRLAALGVDGARVKVTGIPIMPGFAGEPPLSRAQCAARFGLDPARQTVLLMGGGAGVGGLDAVAAALLAMPSPSHAPGFQLLVLAGRNKETLASLQRLAAQYPDRLRPQGFTDQVPELMACADLVVSKPGGLTTSECLAMRLPMILSDPIPGQEEHNADFLLEQGVAMKAIDAPALLFRVWTAFSDPQVLQRMRERAQALARPHAAKAVIEAMLADGAAR